MEDSSDDDSDSKDDVTPVKPARRKKKHPSKKGGSTSSFQPGDKDNPKMKFPREEDYTFKMAFWNARAKYQQTNTKKAKADKLSELWEKVQFEKERQPRDKKRYETAKGFLKRAEAESEESEYDEIGRKRGLRKKRVTFKLKENEIQTTNHSSITPPRRKKSHPHSVVTRQRKHIGED